jgi:small subunit ribosomal protein S16
MSVKIRLRRTGRKKQPSYRLVVANTSAPRDGQYLDAVGTYNPLVKPADLRIDLDKVDRWLAEGAEMTDTVASLVKKARRGGDGTVAVRGVGPEEKPQQEVVSAEPQAEKPKAGSRGAPRAAAVPAAAEAPAEPVAAEPAADEAPTDAAAAGPEPAE